MRAIARDLRSSRACLGSHEGARVAHYPCQCVTRAGLGPGNYRGEKSGLGMRRLYLERLMSHLYYTYDEREVVIRAVWHARRGTGPDFG